MKNIFLTLILAVVLLTTGCMRRQSEFRHRANNERVVNFITKELELDDAQTAKFESIVTTLQDKFDNLETLKTDLEREIISQISAETFDSAPINDIFEKTESEWKVIRIYFVKEIGDFNKGLNEEQRTKLVTWIDESRNKKDHHWH